MVYNLRKTVGKIALLLFATTALIFSCNKEDASLSEMTDCMPNFAKLNGYFGRSVVVTLSGASTPI